MSKVIEAFIEIISGVIRGLTIHVADDVSISFQGRTKGSIDERIAKIDAAKTNLMESLQAIDELKEEAERNKKEIIIAVEQVNRLEKDKTHLQSELEAIRTIVEADVSAFRQVAGLGPSEIRRERLLGFLSGVIASLIASSIFLLIVWLVKHFFLKT